MKERTVNRYVSIPPHDKAAEVAQPREGTFDLPSFSVPSKPSAILRRLLDSFLSVRTNKFDASGCKLFSKGVAVIPFVSDEPFRFSFRSAAAAARNGHVAQRLFDERDLAGARRVQVVSHRNTFAVDHHHPLRSLAAFGLSDAFAPFLAGAKLPSMKASLQSSWPRSSSWLRNARQASSQTSSSSHSRRRRQQVDALGYSLGRSDQGAPVRSIQSIPSKTLRSSAQGRPPFFDLLRLGKNGCIFAHCSSVSFHLVLAIEILLSMAVYHIIPDSASRKYGLF
jgi:hypothetical protein